MFSTINKLRKTITFHGDTLRCFFFKIKVFTVTNLQKGVYVAFIPPYTHSFCMNTLRLIKKKDFKRLQGIFHFPGHISRAIRSAYRSIKQLIRSTHGVPNLNLN